ncbi:Retinol-binding protein 4 [Lamprotornis superbus]|uniref:Retinol-binding protein 4 n=1 Tax=Lamprotornis superbus TaxID=245042 RepID=A0A835NUT9_9PASS|nr:Retinol-binding protein 4 [Lamprotornis superbus]
MFPEVDCYVAPVFSDVIRTAVNCITIKAGIAARSPNLLRYIYCTVHTEVPIKTSYEKFHPDTYSTLYTCTDVHTDRMAHTESALPWLLLLSLALLGSGTAERDCRVSSFKVKENFDKTRYSGTWYAMAKKDPEGLFLQDNVVAQFTVDENGQMTATAKGRVRLFNNWDVCADMIGSFTDTEDPAKFKMKYWGVASFLQKGNDDHWVVDTDYDTYALHYSCRQLNADGTCADSYSFVFSRDPKGLPPDALKIVRQRQMDLCLDRKYRVITHNGAAQSRTKNARITRTVRGLRVQGNSSRMLIPR